MLSSLLSIRWLQGPLTSLRPEGSAQPDPSLGSGGAPPPAAPLVPGGIPIPT